MSPAIVDPPPSQLMVAGVVSFYIVAAIMMVTVNKWVLVSTPAPLFLLFAQMVVAVVLLAASHHARLVKIPAFNRSIAIRLWKLIAINVIGLIFNTFCLQYVDASFYQVARGLVLPITVVLALTTGQAPPSPRALFCCAIVTIGFLVGVLVDQGRNKDIKPPSLIGIFFGIASSCTTAVHSLVIKSSLSVVDDSAIALAWYTNLLSSFVVSLAIPFEMSAIGEMLAEPDRFRVFVIGSMVTGLFGFLICIAGFLSIKVTSPVTHMVSAAARGVIQTFIGVWLLHEVLTRARTSSIFIITLGSCAYVWVKNQEQYHKPLEDREAAAHDYELAGRDSDEADADQRPRGSTDGTGKG